MGNGKSIAGDQKAVPTQETHVWYRTFMMEYPSGLQTLHEFKTLLGLQGLNQKANKHIDQVYNTFDTNKDGFVDFLEFIAAVNLIMQEKMEQKLKWYFKLYDADGNGSIDKNELLDMFMAVQALNGQQTLSPEEFINLVFHKIDINNDGNGATLYWITFPTKGIDFRRIYQWHGKRSGSPGDCLQELRLLQCAESNL
ncbi:guanylyl cyclase-activating protein 3 isoform 2 [Homo sapiens]|uniref:Guanylate cyclase activator 1C n=2 Tax=Homo sapiens TaxID=9606 RepID=C9JNI2_HUMAN|nr:guanylyl cyclase-activating protein 3 isoform 2 [Homo sapiens]EAW79716.1 guanylate cyclase activator 1C, isoform CRA_b [Homo sapiens]|eukprot:XP_005247967.1 guanylyl cyclase-activating protein 3 isoform X1 [Homo sapiens]